MKKISLLLTIISIHLFSFSQDITYKNAWGEEVIGPSIEDAVYEGVSRALDDILDALEEKERKAALERSKMSLAERARKVGVSIPSYSLDDPIGRAAFEGLIIKKERANYLAEVKRARETAMAEVKRAKEAAMKERKSNRTRYNSSANRQSSYPSGNKSSNNVKSGGKFFHYKQPKLFGGDWGTYISGITDIEFVDDKLYNNYYRKVRIKGNVGYINMNSFKAKEATMKERNSNRTRYNSSANRQSSYPSGNKSSNNVKSGVKFFHYKQPKLFGGDWGTYISGITDIEFVDDKLYNNYYRKVRIKGKVGYINMNSFK